MLSSSCFEVYMETENQRYHEEKPYLIK